MKCADHRKHALSCPRRRDSLIESTNYINGTCQDFECDQHHDGSWREPRKVVIRIQTRGASDPVVAVHRAASFARKFTPVECGAVGSIWEGHDAAGERLT